jgi:hypothetical protein
MSGVMAITGFFKESRKDLDNEWRFPYNNLRAQSRNLPRGGMKMDRITWVGRARSAIDAKLGRCPLCMRVSLLGGVIAWAAFALLLLASAPVPLIGTSGIVAAALTLMTLAHFAAYELRVARSIRALQRESRLATSDLRLDIGRREFLGTMARAGVAFALTAALGRSFGFALQGACPPEV